MHASYYLISDNTRHAIVDEVQGWYDHLKRTAMCKQCKHLRPDIRGVDVRIEGEPVEPISFATAAGVAIVSASLVTKLRRAGVPCWVGNVSDAEGRHFKDFRTLRCRRRVVVRGGKKSYGFYCNACDQISYITFGRPYLMGSNVKTKWAMAESQSRSLVVNARVLRLLDLSPRKYRISELELRDEPRDNFADELPFKAQ
jgi:hypothetical protein